MFRIFVFILSYQRLLLMFFYNTNLMSEFFTKIICYFFLLFLYQNHGNHESHEKHENQNDMISFFFIGYIRWFINHLVIYFTRDSIYKQCKYYRVLLLNSTKFYNKRIFLFHIYILKSLYQQYYFWK